MVDEDGLWRQGDLNSGTFEDSSHPALLTSNRNTSAAAGVDINEGSASDQNSNQPKADNS